MSKQKAILRRLRQLERVFTVPSDDNVVIEILEGSHPQADLADRLTRRGDLRRGRPGSPLARGA